MKIAYLLGCTFLILNVSGQVVPSTSVPDNSRAIPIVLTNYYTTPASYFDQIQRYPFRDVPRGQQTLGNVPLDIGGMICLWGSWNTNSGFPEQVTGIKVGRKFDALYLYHIAFSRTPDGTPISELVLRYKDGVLHEHHLLRHARPRLV